MSPFEEFISIDRLGPDDESTGCAGVDDEESGVTFVLKVYRRFAVVNRHALPLCVGQLVRVGDMEFDGDVEFVVHDDAL